jgi:hypothetical protein
VRPKRIGSDGRPPLPATWSIEEANNACFIVRDSTGQALGYFYFEDEPGRRSAAKLLTKDEARRMALNFQSSPEVKVLLPGLIGSIPAFQFAEDDRR